MSLLEVQINPVWTLGREDRVIWESKMTIDLAWVACARPWKVTVGTVIRMAGANEDTVLRIPYSDFMAAWMQAKGIPNWKGEK